MDWFEDESFWEDLYEYMFSDENFIQAIEDTEKIHQLIDIPGKNVLDLCCGPGRFSLAFAKRGYKVTGVDKSAYLLGRAKENAQKEGVAIEFIHHDMRTYLQPDSFDLVTNLFSSFGYFENSGDDIKVLQNIHTNLKPGGLCLFEMMSKECLARIYQETLSEELPDGSVLIHRHKIVDDWSMIHNEWIHVKDGKAKIFRPRLRIYSAREMKDRLLQVGFKDVKAYGDYDGNPYDVNAKRLVVVAKK